MVAQRKIRLVSILVALGLVIIPTVTLRDFVSIYFQGGIEDSSFYEVGVNYLSLCHEYKTADNILERDFSRFYEDGLRIISLNLYWSRLEGDTRGDYDGDIPNKGSYGERVLDDVRRVIRIAGEHGLKVMVTFQTIWGNDSKWCTPDYVIDPISGENIGLAVVRSLEIRQAFVEMFNHTVSYLAHVPNIFAWAILNEPWYWPYVLPSPFEHVDQKENFVSLIQTLSRIVKQLDGRPITVKFDNDKVLLGSDGTLKVKNMFVEDWEWDERLFNALDFVCFNAYIPRESQACGPWKEILAANVKGCHERGKKVVIAEFGFTSNNDFLQAQNYSSSISIFRDLAVEGWIAWFWESDHDLPLVFGEPGVDMSICLSDTGAPRAAYLTLALSAHTSTTRLQG